MKVLAIIPGLLFSAVVLAQGGTPKFRIVPLQEPGINGQRYQVRILPDVPVANKTTQPEKLPNGNYIQSLPQDNMPCIIPDVSGYDMPVVRPELQKGITSIPNPAYPPLSNKPLGPDLETLKKLQNLRPRIEPNQ